jgi:hypothetical protein
VRTSIERIFLSDDRALWRAVLYSWLAATVIGAISSASDATSGTLAVISTVSSLATLALFLFLSQRPRAVNKAPEHGRLRRDLFDYAYAFVSICGFAIIDLRFTNPQTVHASVLDIESKLDGKYPIPERKISSARAALDVVSRFRKDTPRRVADGYMVLSVATAYNRALREMSISHQRTVSATVLNLNGRAALGVAIETSIVFIRSGVTDIAYNGAVGFEDRCPVCSVLVLESIFTNVVQKLDNMTWFKCQFTNCHMLYLSGRLVMFECKFDNCTFEFAPSVDWNTQKAIKNGTASIEMP